jgi:hypothetical protein
MKNVTITLDERTAAWARVQAAKHNMSLSRFIGEMLERRMSDMRTYNEAMQRFLSIKPHKFGWVEGRRPTREELHERTALRRY